jgi:hypothetical protein
MTKPVFVAETQNDGSIKILLLDGGVVDSEIVKLTFTDKFLGIDLENKAKKIANKMLARYKKLTESRKTNEELTKKLNESILR